MNREAGNGLPEKVGIGWRKRDRRKKERCGWRVPGGKFELDF